MTLRQDEKLLHEDRYLKISWIPSDADRMVLCFTGIGHSLGGLDVQQQEFSGTGLKLGAPVFVTDKTRSWGNRLDFSKIQKVLEPVSQGRPSIALGNSMGGFLAIVSSKFLPVQHVLAFAPQYSVDPTVVPGESRWKQYTDRITEFKISSLDGYFESNCNYHIFVGDAEVERMHWSLLPESTNVRCFIVANTHHDVAQTLKSNGTLGAAIRSCLDPTYTEAEIAVLHGFLQRKDVVFNS